MSSLPVRRLLGVLLAMVVLAAACGGDDAEPGDGVASLQTDTSDQAEGPGRQDIEDAVLDFTQCLRNEGIEVPDIQLGADGAPNLDPEALEGIDLRSGEFQRAFTACIGILNSAGAFSFDFDPELQGIIQDQLQAFAECMRTEGVEDFPDPTIGGGGTPFPLSAFTDLDDERFQSALEVCRERVSITGLDG